MSIIDPQAILDELVALRAQLSTLAAQLESVVAQRPVAMSQRRQVRVALGAAAVISVDDAASRLPMDDKDARAWLRNRGLVRDLDGRDVVRWADVLAALEAPPEQARRAASGPIPRIQLP